MKKLFAFSVILTLLTAVLCTHASAAQSVPVDIWVTIQNGGTAVVITEVNSPLPDKSKMTIDDNQSEAFHIEFSEPGNFNYTIRVEPDDRDIRFDDTVYRVSIYIIEENGTLSSNIIIYNEKSGKKYTPQTEGHPDPCTVTFVNNPGPDYPDVPETSTSPAEATTAPVETKDVPDNTSTTEQTPNGDGGTSGKDNDGSSRPKTGDDSTLDFYLLLAIIASAGLFMLSVFYYRSVVKQTQKR